MKRRSSGVWEPTSILGVESWRAGTDIIQTSFRGNPVKTAGDRNPEFQKLLDSRFHEMTDSGFSFVKTQFQETRITHA
jgi:hypothetical protein